MIRRAARGRAAVPLTEECAMRPRIDGPSGGMTLAPHFPAPASVGGLRDTQAVAELSVGVFRRDVQNFFPQALIERLDPEPAFRGAGPSFRAFDDPDSAAVEVELFGARYRIALRDGS